VSAQLKDVDGAMITIVDNGSKDGSIGVIASRYPKVRLLPLGANRGFTGGVRAANGGSPVAFGSLGSAIRKSRSVGGCAINSLTHRGTKTPSGQRHLCSLYSFYRRTIFLRSEVTIWSRTTTFLRDFLMLRCAV